MNEWSPIANVYNPLKAGSIDGTDLEPHDRAVWRALSARYKPNKGVVGDPLLTLYVARLNPETSEERLRDVFSKYGPIQRLRLVRDTVTGFSKRYAFVEYKEERSIVQRTLKGWIPRRLGGGQGGKKESGQLRFGGKDRPFRRPISLAMGHGAQDWATGGARERDRVSAAPNGDRASLREWRLLALWRWTSFCRDFRAGLWANGDSAVAHCVPVWSLTAITPELR
ncbi:hypothetical protein CRUP_037258 [Coryphaenoides rupestris]|nr:hypothetical protein CRUP_037258 [Coryphaenoides rupestris]